MFVITLDCHTGHVNTFLMNELNMRRIVAKFVPHLLNSDRRDHRVQVCTKLQEAVRHDPNFLSRVITGDESWVYDYDPGNKAAVYAMEDAILSTTEKSTPSSQQHQFSADYFFGHSRNCA